MYLKLQHGAFHPSLPRTWENASPVRYGESTKRYVRRSPVFVVSRRVQVITAYQECFLLGKEYSFAIILQNKRCGKVAPKFSENVLLHLYRVK